MYNENRMCLFCVNWCQPENSHIDGKFIKGYCLEHLDYYNFWVCCNEFSKTGDTVQAVVLG